MKTLVVLLAAVLCLAASVGAFAAVSLTAPDTGLVDIPTADLAAPLSVSVAADWQDLSDDTSAVPVRGVVGLMGRAEVGATWTGFDLDGDNEHLIGFAGKIQLLPESDIMPAVAVGARWGKLDLGETIQAEAIAKAPGSGDITSTTVYAVASKQLSLGRRTGYGFAVTGHAGVAWQEVKNDGYFSDSDSSFQGFVGAEFCGPKGLSLAAEYRTEPALSDDPITSVIVRYPLSQQVSAHVGWTNALPGLSIADTEHNVFAGVTYCFGLGGR